MGGVVGGHGDGHGEPVGVPGVSQQLLGLVHVVGIGVGQACVKVLGERRIDGGADLGAVALAGQVEDLVHVHGIAHGLADLLVVEGLHVVVQVQGLDQVHGALQGLVGAGADGVHLVDGQVTGHVHRAGAQGGHEGVGVLIDLEGDLVQVGLLAPVVGELLHDQVLLHGAGDELEGAGAHGGGGLVGVVRRDDIHHAHIGQEVGVGFLQGDGHGVAVRRNIFHRRKRLGQGSVYRGLGAGFEGIDHIIGGDGCAVVEQHALPQGEGIGQTILRHGAVGSHSGHILAAGVGLDQAFIDVK